jgi:hypothetical protein
MDDTGMTHADKVGLVEDVLEIWGEDTTREFAHGNEVRLTAVNR